VISGFAPTDTIDLRAVSFDSRGTAQLLAGNLLRVTENGATFNFNLDPAQNFAGESFILHSDGHSGTDIVVGPAVNSGQTLNVSSGQTISNLSILSGGTVMVRSGVRPSVPSIPASRLFHPAGARAAPPFRAAATGCPRRRQNKCDDPPQWWRRGRLLRRRGQRHCRQCRR
jgi:hypothetical protein